MAPTPAERALERRLAAAAQDPAERPALNRELLDSEVYVLGTVEGESSIRMLGLTDDEGPFTPFFTSEDALRELLDAHPDCDPRYVRLGCRAMFEMAGGARLVLNPYSAYGKVYLPAEVAAILSGNEPGVQAEVLEAGRTVFLGAAAHVPPDLPAVLARFFTQRPTVEAAHLGWIVHPDGHAGYLMLVVAGDQEQAMAGFGSVAVGELTGGETLDVMVFPPGSDSTYLSAVPRFYERGRQADVPPERKRRWGRRP